MADGEVGPTKENGIWLIYPNSEKVVPLLPESEHGSFSPDGDRIAYSKELKFWVMGADGANAQGVLDLDQRYDWKGPKWSPDGQRIVYLKNEFRSSDGSIEALKLGETTPTVLFSGAGLGGMDFSWTPDGRLIYTQASASGESTYGLWERLIDLTTAKPTATPHQLTSWDGPSPGFVSVSLDGKKIVTTKGYTQNDVYVAELEKNGLQLGAERQLTRDTRADWPAEWTKDGQLLFYSERNGAFTTFKQGISDKADQPEVVLGGNEDRRSPQFSPDGQWLLYMLWPPTGRKDPVRILRAPQTGGLAQLALEAKGDAATGVAFSPEGSPDSKRQGPRMFPDFRCPSVPQTASACVIAEADQENVVFTLFDPTQGRQDKLPPTTVTAPPSKFFWDLSPDGSHIAYGEFRMREDDFVTVLKLDDQTEQKVPMPKWSRFSSLAWSADGRALFVTTSLPEGSDLLRVSLDGKVALLKVGETGRWFLNPRPSPDGKRLAYAIRTTDSNVWLIETK